MNRALPPGDCGHRSSDLIRSPRFGRFVPGSVGLVGGASHPPKRGTPPELNPAARRSRNGQCSGFNRVVAPAVLSLSGRDRQSHFLANGPRQKPTNRMGLPASGFHQFRSADAARSTEQFKYGGGLAAVAGDRGLRRALGRLLRGHRLLGRPGPVERNVSAPSRRACLFSRLPNGGRRRLFCAFHGSSHDVPLLIGLTSDMSLITLVPTKSNSNFLVCSGGGRRHRSRDCSDRSAEDPA
jgi:hypothetical protein